MSAASTTLSAALSFEHRPDRIAIRRGARTLLVQNASPGKRPFIHPIVAPDGDGVLTEDAPSHHPWQHGLYVGLNDVDGIGFWTEGLTGNAQDGSFHPRPLDAPKLVGDRAEWSVITEWRRPDGSALLSETQAWSFSARGDAGELDLTWTLRAAAGDVRFGKSAYGGLFVRMPYRTQGSVVTSAGHRDAASAEAQPARWVAIAMPIPDRRAADPVAGLALMDHPSNPGHPTPWRVDGQLGIAPSRCIAGAWRLSAATPSTSRYRVLIHAGATDVGAVEASWARFAV